MPRVDLSADAERQLRDLIAYYEKMDRPAATRNLLAAVEAAQQKIAANPAAGLLAPRVYPKLKKPGRRWVKSGRYWISYIETTPPIISSVFFETVDIPNWPSLSS